MVSPVRRAKRPIGQQVVVHGSIVNPRPTRESSAFSSRSLPRDIVGAVRQVRHRAEPSARFAPGNDRLGPLCSRTCAIPWQPWLPTRRRGPTQATAPRGARPRRLHMRGAFRSTRSRRARMPATRRGGSRHPPSCRTHMRRARVIAGRCRRSDSTACASPAKRRARPAPRPRASWRGSMRDRRGRGDDGPQALSSSRAIARRMKRAASARLPPSFWPSSCSSATREVAEHRVERRRPHERARRERGLEPVDGQPGVLDGVARAPPSARGTPRAPRRPRARCSPSSASRPGSRLRSPRPCRASAASVGRRRAPASAQPATRARARSCGSRPTSGRRARSPRARGPRSRSRPAGRRGSRAR